MNPQHPETREVTYPAEIVQDIANRLSDADWNLPADEAYDAARDIVIDVTMAVDKLRAAEGTA